MSFDCLSGIYLLFHRDEPQSSLVSVGYGCAVVLWEPVSAQLLCTAHILRVNSCLEASWAAQSHVSSPHSSLGPLKWTHPPGALGTTKTTNTGLLSEGHRCTHARTQMLKTHLFLIQCRLNTKILSASVVRSTRMLLICIIILFFIPCDMF